MGVKFGQTEGGLLSTEWTQIDSNIRDNSQYLCISAQSIVLNSSVWSTRPFSLIVLRPCSGFFVILRWNSRLGTTIDNLRGYSCMASWLSLGIYFLFFL